MARLQVVSYTLTCDLCGDEIPDLDSENASRTVSWDGAEYALDLCETHQAELGETLDQLRAYVVAGDRVGAGRSRRASRSSRPTGARGRRSSAPASSGSGARRSDVAVIRSWARENGYKVGDRARIAGSIVAAYDEAHNSPPPTKKRGGRKATTV